MDVSTLERRLLFSASPVVSPEVAESVDLGGQDSALVTDPDVLVQESATANGEAIDAGSESDSSQDRQRLELVFVDASVDDHEQLISDLKVALDQDELEIYLLDSSRDGVEQIGEILSGYSDVDAVHILSHGSDGKIRLGSSLIESRNLEAFAGDLAGWASSLSTDADLAFYGCRLAESESGRMLLEAVSALTGADVAASDDDTGHASLGGDWDLEATFGQVETLSLLDAASNVGWTGLLATPQLTPTGETLVNTTVSGSQYSDGGHNTLAVDDSGNTVVVWVDDSGADGDNTGIFAQRFDAQGNRIGGEFQINANSSGSQSWPVVASTPSGEFIVGWVSSDGDGDGIYVRRFDANGDAIDSVDLLVNAGQTAGDQSNITLATNANGEIVIAWESDGINEGIFARTFDISAVVSGGELTSPLIQVDTSTNATEAAVDLNEAGRYVVVWNDSGQLYGRRYDYGTTTALAGKDNLSQTIVGDSDVVVTVSPDNTFAVAYYSGFSGFKGVWHRVFSVTGVGQTSTKISSGEVASAPTVSMDLSGNYVIAFQEVNSGSTGSDVFFQVFDANHDLYGSLVQANETTDNDQVSPSAALHDLDNVVIAWSGRGDQTGQVDDDGVFIRQFGPELTNTPPTASGLNQSINYVEDGGTVLLGDIVVSDADAGETITATLTLVDPNAGSLSTGSFGAATSTYDGVTGIWSVSGSVDDVNSALASVSFSPASDYDLDVNVLTHVEDAAGTGPTDGVIGLHAMAVNDPAVIDLDADDSGGVSGVNFDATFIEGAGAVLVVDAGDATITDVDNTSLVSLQVTITNPFDIGNEQLSADTSGTLIDATFVGATLTLSGADTIANYQQVLRTIRYQNVSANPTLVDRTLAFTVNDGAIDSNTATATVSISASNDAPVIDLDADDSSGTTGADFTANFVEGGGAVVIADSADAALADADSSNLASLTVTITNLLDGAAESLTADTTGTSIMANYSGGVLTLSGSDTVANYQQVLRTVRYDNASANPDSTDRIVEFAANDGAA
ncbi:DUF4347 domain-containing protein, partial [Roseiconus nitratireducens]|uniref:DUF4347 domain-containing protein n=1 Tax=Roseiconus nitratireducens TaxID=2605748 RepID=UPI0013763CA4